MAVTPADVRAIAKDYAALQDADIQLFLDEAVLRVNRAAFGDAKADRATIYLTAHLLQLDAEQGKAGAGAVSQMHAGDLELQYAVGQPQGTPDELRSTAWGRRYLELERVTFASRVI